MQVVSDLLLPLMADLARLVSTRSKEFPGRHSTHAALVHHMGCKPQHELSSDLANNPNKH